MSEEIFREYRKDQFGVTDTIVLGVPDLHKSQTITNGGKVADTLIIKGQALDIYSPSDPLFVRGANPDGYGYGATHDFGTMRGFDEMCLAQGANGLEIVTQGLVTRIQRLDRDTEMAPHLRQVYIYGVLDLATETAAGRLLLTREVFPNIRVQVEKASEHETARGRCFTCDIYREREKLTYPVCLRRGIFRAYSPFSPGDVYSREIIPAEHINSHDQDKLLNHLGDLAVTIHDLAEGISRKAREHRETDDVIFAIHSAPRNFRGAETSLHMRVLVALAEKQDKNGPYQIPFAGVKVINQLDDGHN